MEQQIIMNQIYPRILHVPVKAYLNLLQKKIFCNKIQKNHHTDQELPDINPRTIISNKSNVNTELLK